MRPEIRALSAPSIIDITKHGDDTVRHEIDQVGSSGGPHAGICAVEQHV